MESIQSNHPVMLRAVEFVDEARHRRALQQEAAAKIENPLKEQPAVRVTFSQEAQTRLNEEKTHAANLVNEVRVAERSAAAEARAREMRAEREQALVARIEAQDLRVERDHIARDKAAVSDKMLAAISESVEKTAEAKRNLSAAATEKAIEQQTLQAEQFVERRNAIDFERTFKAKVRETNDFLEKQKRSVVIKNMEISKVNDEVAVEQVQKVKKINERAKAETEKVTKMYQRIESMS